MSTLMEDDIKRWRAKRMSIVSDAALDNTAKANQIKAITGLVEIAVPLLKKLL
jgi:hypothetical protein